MAPGCAAACLLACATAPVVTILWRSWGTTIGNLSKARSGADMKVNIEIDCTPLEARQFFGLPDVGPMQNAVMDKLQTQMISNIDKISPESLIQSWFSFDPKLADRMQDMFVSMTGLGALSSDKKK
jgi:Family of unknown function (DUF6489)